ncbi:MAG: AraC family transcriptional regulator [Victivallaceae bacterium]
MCKNIDFLIMEYFDGITFIGSTDHPTYTGFVQNRFFDGYYGIQYNHRGALEFSIDNSAVQHVEGSWCFISHPGARFDYGSPPGESRHHCFVCFKGKKIEQYIRGGLMVINRNQPLLKIGNPERFLSTLRELIMTEHQPMTSVQHGRAVLLLEYALLQMHEPLPAMLPEGNYLTPQLEMLSRNIQQNPCLEWNFKAEAAAIGISYPHFRRLFRKHTGSPPGQYMIECRLRGAASQLLRSDTQISVIAENCGFEDEFYFSRLFKQHYQLSPLNYRKEFRMH